MIELRDYQVAAVDAVFNWDYDEGGQPLVVVPTGGGKSLIQASVIRDALEDCPKLRILCVTHLRELIAQNHNALLDLAPELASRAGIYSAGIGIRQVRQITFAGLQSVYNKGDTLCEIAPVDLVIVDEAHLIPSKGFGMYRTLLAELRSRNPSVRLLGLTATPFRTDSGELDKGDAAMFGGVAYTVDILNLIDRGFLCALTCRGAQAKIDTTGVHRRMGDYIIAELEQAALREGLVESAVREIIDRGGDRKAWLVFCCTVAHAEFVAEELDKHGIPVVTVFGHTKKDERDAATRAIRTGEARCVVNVSVLTTGFDAPNIDLIALLRPTESPGLYVQMVGRGLRVAEGKTDCLVLDFGNNVMRHGPINDVTVRKPGHATGESPATPQKECPECQLILHASTMKCPDCGYAFPPPTPQHSALPDDGIEILTRGDGTPTGLQKWEISRVDYHLHIPQDPKKPTSLRVTYWAALNKHVSEWVGFNHQGYARKKAEQWWRQMAPNTEVPDSVDLALVLIELGRITKKVTGITVDLREEWPRIKGKRLVDNHDALERLAMQDEQGLTDDDLIEEHSKWRQSQIDELPF